jgi:hypothetical protein
MDDEPGRLLEHREMLVLVHEPQVRMGGGVGARRRFRGRHLDRDFISSPKNRRCAQRLPACADALIGDETCGLSAGQGELVGEEFV